MPITFTATTLSFSLPGLMGSNPGQNWIVLWGVITNCAISYFYSKNFVTFMPQSYEKTSKTAKVKPRFSFAEEIWVSEHLQYEI